MPKWRVQIYWWGLVGGYPSSLWKTIEEHDTEEAMVTSLNNWTRLHGKVATYRGLDPNDKVWEPVDA